MKTVYHKMKRTADDPPCSALPKVLSV